MSSPRLPTLSAEPTTSRSTGYIDNPEFNTLTQSLASRLTTLTANIVQLNQQLSKNDSKAIRLLTDTRKGFREISLGVKRAREWSSDYNASPDIKLAQQKLMDRFISTLQDFQGVQRLGAEKVRMYGRPERYRDEEEAVPALAQAEGESREREEEIRGIEEGIEEVNDIFKEFGVDVQEQNEELDAIRGDAEWELEREARYRARKRAGCFLLFVALVVVIVVGAVFLR